MKNITPKNFPCACLTCPQLFEDGEDLVIVGKTTKPPKNARIGDDETAIVVPKTLFADFKK